MLVFLAIPVSPAVGLSVLCTPPRRPMTTDGMYHEYIMPWFAPLAIILPMFLRYSVCIDDTTLDFGYLTPLCRVKIPRSQIDKTSVTTGSSSFMENLKSFGGWGIRWGGPGKWVYNPIDGPWVELRTTTGKEYRFVTRNHGEVAKILVG